MHSNGHLKKKTVQKLQLKEDNWNSYLTENKFKISDEERIQKKKLYMSKNNMIRSSSLADSKKSSRDQKGREVNALDLLMMGDDDNDHHHHNSAQKMDEDIVNERHKTFLPASPPSSSSSKMRKNRIPVTKHQQASPSPSSGCTASAVVRRRRTVDKEDIMLSEGTAVTEMDGSHDTVLGMDQKQVHVKTSISSKNRKSSRRLFTSSMKPDPDWKHITSNIRSLYAELRYYEELSGKRSILDTRDELNDMLMDKELNDPQSNKAIMQYLLDLVCQSLTYLLKNEVELQEERSKNDLLNAQLEDYRNGSMHDPRPKDVHLHPYTTGHGTITTASVPQVDSSQLSPSLHVHTNSSIGESIPPDTTHPYSGASTPFVSPSSTWLPVSISRGGDDRNDSILTLNKMQALGQLSGPYVDAYASYLDSPIRMGDHRVDGEHSGGRSSGTGGIAESNSSTKHLFPSLDLSRMDALINYSKAITVDNDCSTIDRLSSMASSSYHHSVVRTNSRLIDGYDSDDSIPPPPPSPSHVIGSSYRMAPPPPPVLISSAQEQMKRAVSERPFMQATNAPLLRMTSKQDAAISMRMMNNEGRMNSTGDGTATTPVTMQSMGPVSVNIEQMKTSKPSPSPMTMNGSSSSDWLFFDFSTPTPFYTGLPPHQSSSATTTTTTHLYPTGISSSIAGNDSHDDGGGRGEFGHNRQNDHYDQHSRGISVPEQEQSYRKASTGRQKCMTEQVSIVQPLVDVPVPHTAPTHPYIHHQARSSSSSGSSSSSSSSSSTDHAISYQLLDDSGMSPIAKELMNQYRLPLQQRTFDARNGSF